MKDELSDQLGALWNDHNGLPLDRPQSPFGQCAGSKSTNSLLSIRDAQQMRIACFAERNQPVAVTMR